MCANYLSTYGKLSGRQALKEMNCLADLQGEVGPTVGTYLPKLPQTRCRLTVARDKLPMTAPPRPGA